jgi:cardiolipin synthase
MNFANKISTFRILSVPFFVACLIYYSPQRPYLRFIALSIFVLAVISDAVDGYIARKARLKSKAGLILDPLGDKLLLMSAFIFLYKFPVGEVTFPKEIILIVLSRDIIILLGAVVLYMVRQSIDITPTIWGKLTTIFQMSSVLAVILQLDYAYIFWWLAIFLTVISGADYIRRGFKVLYAMDNSRNNH